jgi:hypothetical protein
MKKSGHELSLTLVARTDALNCQCHKCADCALIGDSVEFSRTSDSAGVCVMADQEPCGGEPYPRVRTKIPSICSGTPSERTKLGHNAVALNPWSRSQRTISGIRV